MKGKAGGTPKSSNKLYYDGNIPFLSINDMTKQGKYIKKTEKLITKEGLENSSAWIIPKDSLVYSMYASVGLVGINKKEITTSQAIYGIILNDEKATLEYMYYYLVYFKKNIHKYIETGTQGNINAKTLKKFKIKIPSLEEQKKIGDFLSKIDKKIRLMEQKQEELEKFKKYLFQKLFDSSDCSNIVTLGSVSEKIASGNNKEVSDGKFVLYGSIDIIGKSEDSFIDGEALLMARVGANTGTINFVNGTYGVSDNAIAIIFNDNIDCLYMYYLLSTLNLNKYIIGSGRPLIKASDIKKIKVNLPTYGKQQEVSNFLKAVDKKINLTENKISAMKKFKSGLLQKMFV